MISLGIRSYFHDLLFGRRISQGSPNLVQNQSGWELRDALLKCSTLTEHEVEEYIAYECEGIVYEDVPLDYELTHPDEEVSGLYFDGIAQSKVVRKHTNQISQETLEKVQRVLPVIRLQ